ncbi:hypothetical protein MUK42_37244 [Musa troglodytarum]|uniref:Uncharacterized protein n=1 Tax=Musa troglodytarum TaxID=320322 RepID=A0A9E7JXM6_9LILI|nr:hypothetical protein MUK42_37244 [Musa troglodytarum]
MARDLWTQRFIDPFLALLVTLSRWIRSIVPFSLRLQSGNRSINLCIRTSVYIHPSGPSFLHFALGRDSDERGDASQTRLMKGEKTVRLTQFLSELSHMRRPSD